MSSLRSAGVLESCMKLTGEALRAIWLSTRKGRGPQIQNEAFNNKNARPQHC